MDQKIRVLIVDDSPLVRETIKEMLSSDPDIEVVGLAKDGKEGVEKALALKPNVITMDLKMPLMGGLDAIEEIMEELPTPIIVVSSMDIEVIVAALGVGAMDFVPITDNIDEIAMDLLSKVKIASRIKPIRRMHIVKRTSIAVGPKTVKKEANKIVAIGVSTGGPQALQVVLNKLPHDLPAGILIVQHIAQGFIGGLVEWMRLSCHIDVAVAKAGELLKTGTALFAPDGYNTTINEEGKIVLSEDMSKRMLHVPSIDVMMKSAADSYGRLSVGVIMTGMGKDGKEGMCAIKAASGTTIAQDQATSVIFGMNKESIDTGCIDKIVALNDIADEIVRSVQ